MTPMADVRALFAELGHTDVRTYIQSGNVVFTTARGQPASLRAAIERALASAFGFDIPTLLRTATDLAKTVQANPFGPTAYVTFLDGAPDHRRVATLDASAFEPDEFAVKGAEVFLRCPNGYGRTKLNNTFFERRLATGATTRNWKTVTTLLDWVR